MLHRVLRRIVEEESGQDLVEYALLTTFVSLAAVVCFDLLTGAIGTSYNSWGTGVNSIWESPPPSGS